jgi:hypothetical protein
MASGTCGTSALAACDSLLRSPPKKSGSVAKRAAGGTLGTASCVAGELLGAAEEMRWQQSAVRASGAERGAAETAALSQQQADTTRPIIWQ